MNDYITQTDTPIGTLVLHASEKSLNSISFDKMTIKENSNSLLEITKNQIQKYFSGELKEFKIPLNLKGSDFQKKCWRVLSEIPYGETLSYKEQAIKVGGANYARAVAGANNKNPFPIIIPCHRVIGFDGSLVGYAAGLMIKKYLLDLEKSFN